MREAEMDNPRHTAAQEIDAQILESIIGSASTDDFTPPISQSLAAVIAKYHGHEPDGAVVTDLVSAALGNFWSSPSAERYRHGVCDGVAQRLLEDPVALLRLRRLLETPEKETP